MRLEEKVALISGAARGQGAAEAKVWRDGAVAIRESKDLNEECSKKREVKQSQRTRT